MEVGHFDKRHGEIFISSHQQNVRFSNFVFIGLLRGCLVINQEQIIAERFRRMLFLGCFHQNYNTHILDLIFGRFVVPILSDVRTLI